LNEVSTDDLLNVVDTDEIKKNDDARSSITFATDATTLINQPLSQVSTTSSKLELQLDYLAKELELEKQRRIKLAN
jgi:hypothetical protein